MIATINQDDKKFIVDFSRPIDISRAVEKKGVKAWGVNEPVFEPVKIGKWIGEVKQGGSVNFRNVFFNPHGHGTHTECVGHISSEDYSINKCLNKFMFFSKLISVSPQNIYGDAVVTKSALSLLIREEFCEALIIRTSGKRKKNKTENYTNTNPPFIHEDGIRFLLKKGVNHLLIDSPSVDRESDNGKLLAHHAFWEYPQNTKQFRTITELIKVPASVKDGYYLLSLQVAPFENDAAPSRPVLYKLKTELLKK